MPSASVQRLAVASPVRVLSGSPTPHDQGGDVRTPLGTPSSNPARIGCAPTSSRLDCDRGDCALPGAPSLYKPSAIVGVSFSVFMTFKFRIIDEEEIEHGHVAA